MIRWLLNLGEKPYSRGRLCLVGIEPSFRLARVGSCGSLTEIASRFATCRFVRSLSSALLGAWAFMTFRL